MRALKIAGSAIAAVIVVAALLLIIGIPSGFLTSAIQARVERETGYRLTIAGTTRIGLWPSLNVTLNDVTLQHPKDRDGANRITVGSVQADMTLASVWSGHPQVTELVIHASGAACAAAARAQRPGQRLRQTGHRRGRSRCQRARDRPRDGDRRRGRVLQPARPRGEPHRRHQRSTPRSAAIARSRSPAARAPASIRSNSTSTRPRPPRRWSGRTFRSSSRSRRPARCRRRCRPRPRSGSTARSS